LGTKDLEKEVKLIAEPHAGQTQASRNDATPQRKTTPVFAWRLFAVA
jgi:hypothetical protein